MSIIHKIATDYNFSEHCQAEADLCIIAFFYLLQVGEYTNPGANATKDKTHQLLHKCNICLWYNGKLLLLTLPLSILLTADSATICIANIKNGTKGAVVHHKVIAGSRCPIAALAIRLHNITQGSPTCPISTVFHKSQQPTHISNRDITIAV